MKKQSQLLTISIFAASFQIANAADLATTFSSSHSKITLNNTITYTGSVVNKGVDSASNVQLIFYMPPKNVSIGNLPSGCFSSGSKITCSIGELNAGDSASRSINVSYSAKSGNIASVNAVTDSYDSNYSDNFSRLTTNATASTSSANSPLIPNVFSAKVSPTAVLQGNSVTFSANLNAPLPSGYSVKVSFDGNTYAMSGFETKYNLTQTPSATGLKTFTVGVYDNYGTLRGNSQTGTFEVTKANAAPTLSLISGADSVTAGTAYILQLQASDADGNLSNIQITNWGDGSSDYKNAANNANIQFAHTFSSAGSYTISAIAYDAANASSTAISKTITVSQPVVTQPVVTQPVVTPPVTSTTGYTKIANNGSILPDNATLGTAPTDWACTKDNNTGLIWEVKTDDGGLRDKDWRYSWYEPDASKNGGFEGYPNDSYAKCSTSDNCNTYAFTNAVNQQGLCGAKDWRMPTKDELFGILKSDTSFPSIDTAYFPNTGSSNFVFWSSSPDAGNTNLAWFVFFDFGGDSYGNNKSSSDLVRLVRNGQ